MPLVVTCPCGQLVAFEDQQAGRIGQCPHCGSRLNVAPRSTGAQRVNTARQVMPPPRSDADSAAQTTAAVRGPLIDTSRTTAPARSRPSSIPAPQESSLATAVGILVISALLFPATVLVRASMEDNRLAAVTPQTPPIVPEVLPRAEIPSPPVDVAPAPVVEAITATTTPPRIEPRPEPAKPPDDPFSVQKLETPAVVPSPPPVSLGEVHSALNRVRQALTNRDLAGADAQLRSARLLPGADLAKQELDRLQAVHGHAAHFWNAVDQAEQSLAINSVTDFRGLKVRKAQTANGPRLVDLTGTSTYTRGNMPQSLALGLANMKLHVANVDDLLAVGAFHMIDSKDVRGATYCWDRAAAYRKSDVDQLWPELGLAFLKSPPVPWQIELPSGTLLNRGDVTTDADKHQRDPLPTGVGGYFDLAGKARAMAGFEFATEELNGPVISWQSSGQPSMVAQFNDREQLNGPLYLWNAEGEPWLYEDYLSDRPNGGITCLFVDRQPRLIIERDKLKQLSVSVYAADLTRANYGSEDDLKAGSDADVGEKLDVARQFAKSQKIIIKGAVDREVKKLKKQFASSNSVQARQNIMGAMAARAAVAQQALGDARSATGKASARGGYNN